MSRGYILWQHAGELQRNALFFAKLYVSRKRLHASLVNLYMISISVKVLLY